MIVNLITLSAYCCDCDEKTSIEKNWELADQVFIAKIIKVDSLLYGEDGLKLYSFKVKIKTSYKSEVYDGQEYRSVLFESVGSCDFPFIVGREYLIYSKSSRCSICSRTDLLSNIEKDEIATLEKLHQDYIKNGNQNRIIRFSNNIEYQINLVKNSFEEKLKRKDLLIFILLGISVLLLLLLTILMIKRRNSK